MSLVVAAEKLKVLLPSGIELSQYLRRLATSAYAAEYPGNRSTQQKDTTEGHAMQLPSQVDCGADSRTSAIAKRSDA